MGFESFDHVELTALFPDLSEEEAGRIRAAAVEVETARRADDSSGWGWWPEHLRHDPTHPGSLVALSTSMILFDGDDGPEFSLNVVREGESSLTISASIDVLCWCDTDHGMHEVRSERWLVGTAAAFTTAFESAAKVVIRWAGETGDRHAHRNAAGLPGPKPR